MNVREGFFRNRVVQFTRNNWHSHVRNVSVSQLQFQGGLLACVCQISPASMIDKQGKSHKHKPIIHPETGVEIQKQTCIGVYMVNMVNNCKAQFTTVKYSLHV